jgi:hypothetical protein
MTYAFVKTETHGDRITGFFVNRETGDLVPVKGVLLQTTSEELLATKKIDVLSTPKAKPFLLKYFSISKPYVYTEGPPSLDLLNHPPFIERDLEYAIRVHYNNRPHFDFAVGDRADPFCVDFVVAGATKAMVQAKTPYFPINRKVPLFFQPAHPISFLTSDSGDIPAEAGPSKAGHWEVVQRGKAKVTRHEDHFNIRLIDIGIKLSIFKGGRGPSNWLVQAETLGEEEKPVTKTPAIKPKTTIPQKIVPLDSRWGKVKCKVWDKAARWAYYTNPFISKQIISFIKWFNGTRIDTWLISEHEFDRNINKPKELDGITYAKKAIFRSIASVESILALEEPIAKLQEINSGISDIMTRVPKNPKVYMLDIDVNVPKLDAVWATQLIENLMLDKYYPWTVFSGKTGYHVFYQPKENIEFNIVKARSMVESLVEDLNLRMASTAFRKPPKFVAGVQHPPEGYISIDWSQGSSSNKVVVVPFSLRWDSCFASVPINFKKLNFDPDVHADPDYVLAHPDQYV